jgi:hypothetical protein
VTGMSQVPQDTGCAVAPQVAGHARECSASAALRLPVSGVLLISMAGGVTPKCCHGLTVHTEHMLLAFASSRWNEARLDLTAAALQGARHPRFHCCPRPPGHLVMQAALPHDQLAAAPGTSWNMGP